MTVLEQIAAQVRVRITEDQARFSEDDLLTRFTHKPRSFRNAFAGPPGRVIAEIKFASPSNSGRSTHNSPAAVAQDYLRNGATALSVLTERDFFKGHPDYLYAIRAENPDALILMKDFFVSSYQLAMAKALGADAVLLIAALLGESLTKSLLKRAGELGLDALVEVHNKAEMEMALNAGAKLIGVNNRNLKTLEVSLQTSYELAELAPRDVTLISESGITLTKQLIDLYAIGYRGFLVGNHLMKAGNPGSALRLLIGGAI